MQEYVLDWLNCDAFKGQQKSVSTNANLLSTLQGVATGAKREELKDFNDFHLKAKARFWP